MNKKIFNHYYSKLLNINTTSSICYKHLTDDVIRSILVCTDYRVENLVTEQVLTKLIKEIGSQNDKENYQFDARTD